MNRVKDIIRAYPPNGITGTGVGIAILDTGISLMSDFTFPKNRVVAFKDFVNGIQIPYDDNGHGTHVSGIVASNGTLSNGIYKGVAPECNIISLKILDEAGHGTSSWALDAIKWIYINHEKYNIRVVNMSIGTNDSVISLALLNAVKSLYNAGITVAAAAGNDNFYRISAPGTSPYVITAGAMEAKKQFKLKNMNLYYTKPDVFAPSENIISCKCENFSFDSPNRSIDKTVDKNYISMSGTSMATPMISGAAALLYSYNSHYTPKDIKKIIKSSAIKNNNLLNIESMFK